MRTVYFKILLWSFATLMVSLAAFVAVTAIVSSRTAFRSGFFGHASLEMEEARQAYEEGGPAKLAGFIQRIERYIPGKHHLTDARGFDLLTGADLSTLIAAAQPEGTPPPISPRRRGIVVATSNDGRYRWIVEMGPPPFNLSSFLPYYILIFAAVALVC